MGKKAISEARIGTKTKSVDWTKLLHSGFSVIKESLKDEIPVKLISKHKDTQQTKEQSYSCSFCPKTFSTGCPEKNYTLFFSPNFQTQSLRNGLSESLEI